MDASASMAVHGLEAQKMLGQFGRPHPRVSCAKNLRCKFDATMQQAGNAPVNQLGGIGLFVFGL